MWHAFCGIHENIYSTGIREPNHVQTQYNKLTQPFFISPFLSDDVTRAPDLWLAAAAAHCAAKTLPHFCWAFATNQWNRMHSQGSCFIHPGLYRSLEPTGLPQAVSTVPAPCTVVQTHRWVRLPWPKKVVIRKSAISCGKFIPLWPMEYYFSTQLLVNSFIIWSPAVSVHRCVKGNLIKGQRWWPQWNKGTC